MNHSKQFTKVTNWTLLLVGLVVVASGVYIQVKFHLSHSPTTSSSLREAWNELHVWSSFLFLIAVMLHLYLHLKWYKAIFRKRLFKRNRITLILSLLFVVSALTGIMAWIVKGDSATLYHLIVETHDKIALLFLLFVVGHTIKRFRFFMKNG